MLLANKVLSLLVLVLLLWDEVKDLVLLDPVFLFKLLELLSVFIFKLSLLLDLLLLLLLKVPIKKPY